MYGLVFAGGGAKGAYQIGAWKALIELNIEIGIVCGTSVGALNGALFAQKDFELAKDLWFNMTMETVFKADQEIISGLKNTVNLQIFQNSLSFYKKLYNYLTENKGLNITPLRNQIQDLLDEDKLRESGIQFGFVTYNMDAFAPMKIYADELEDGELKYFLLGSALVPGFAQDPEFPVKFMDGGVYDRFPIQMAIDKGYKKIIAVETRNKKVKKYENANVTYIIPSEDTGNFLVFDQKQSLKNFEMGYLDTLKTFNKLTGIKYYFTDFPTETKIIKNFIAIKPSKLKKLFEKTQNPNQMTLKQLFEIELPNIFKKLPVKKYYTYRETLMGLLEYLLELNEVERLKKYTYHEALELCNKQYTDDSIEKEIHSFLTILLK